MYKSTGAQHHMCYYFISLPWFLFMINTICERLLIIFFIRFQYWVDSVNNSPSPPPSKEIFVPVIPWRGGLLSVPNRVKFRSWTLGKKAYNYSGKVSVIYCWLEYDIPGLLIVLCNFTLCNIFYLKYVPKRFKIILWFGFAVYPMSKNQF